MEIGYSVYICEAVKPTNYVLGEIEAINEDSILVKSYPCWPNSFDKETHLSADGKYLLFLSYAALYKFLQANSERLKWLLRINGYEPKLTVKQLRDIEDTILKMIEQNENDIQSI